MTTTTSAPSTERTYPTIARSGAFYLLVLLFVGMGLAFVGFLIQWGIEAWYSTGFGGHRIHQIADGTLIAVIVLGVLVQLYRPTRRVAALQTSLVVLVAFAAFAIAGGGSAVESMTFVALAVLIAILHPARGDLLPALSRDRVSPAMAGLTAIAALPLLAFAVHQFGLQLTLADDHAAIGHWGNMAAFAVSVVLLGFLASLKPRWWLFPAVVAGVFAIEHGVASIVFDAPSGVGAFWGGLEVLWGLAFVAVATMEHYGVLADRSTTSATAQSAE